MTGLDRKEYKHDYYMRNRDEIRRWMRDYHVKNREARNAAPELLRVLAAWVEVDQLQN
jgi:hypothetical protein